jgi:hypothetical protein
MPSWSALDWICYLCIAIAALIPALAMAVRAEAGLERLSSRVINSQWWKLTPAAALVTSGVIISGTWLGFWNQKISQPQCANPAHRAVIGTYGMQGTLPFVQINSANVGVSPDKFSLILIARVAYSDIDDMKDKSLDISDPYTITGQTFYMAAKNGAMRWVKSGTNLIQFYAVAVPNGIQDYQIHTLSDVKTLGGVILDRQAASISGYIK